MPTVTKKYYHNIDLDNNQLINAVVENLATAPTGPVDGQIYYNTVDKKIYYYKDSTAGWIAIGSDVVYQVPITLTTTGTSGAATFNPGTGALNIPQYSSGVTGSATNIYTDNGTLTGDRVVTSGGFSLTLNPKTFFDNGVTFNATTGNVGTFINTQGYSTISTQLYFYPNSGTNVAQTLNIIPRGTGFNSVFKAQFSVYNTDTIADPSNTEFVTFRAAGSLFTFASGKFGTGVIRPLMFSAGYATDSATNINQLYLSTAGNVLIGSASDTGLYKLDVNGTARVNGNINVQNGSSINVLRTNGLDVFVDNGRISSQFLTVNRAINNNEPRNISVVNFLVDGNSGNQNFIDHAYVKFSANGTYTQINIGAFTHAQFSKGTLANYTDFRAIDVVDMNTFFGSTSGSVGIGATYTINSSAIFQITSNTKGFLPPRMTNAQLAAISSPAVGLIVYQTDGTEGLYQYKNTGGWAVVAGAAGGSGTVTSVGLSVPTGLSVANSPITSSGSLNITFTAGYSIPTTASQTSWDTAFTERRYWDGGATNLVAATGRTSLGATSVGSNLFTLTNPSAVTFIRINADNSVSTLDAAAFRTAIEVGSSSNNGTVTSVAALTIGTTGTDLTSSVATGTTTPVITLNVPTASAANRGALSAADWSTFNGKQAALSGTGFVKISGTTISYDNSTYYLASNPSGYTTNTGTVTTVSVTTANGVSGSVATAGTTPAITLTLGAITPTSVNGLTFTASATGFTIAGGTTSKTLTLSNTLTFAGTDSSTLNIGAGGTLGSAAFTASTAYQAFNTNLTSLAGLTFASTSFVKMTAAGTFALDTNTYYLASNPSGYTNNTGTVTTVSVTTANGVSGSVATAGTTPAITISLGAITPTSVNSVVLSGSTTPTLSVTGTSSISGSNTGDQINISGNATTATTAGSLTSMNISQFTNNSGYITESSDFKYKALFGTPSSAVIDFTVTVVSKTSNHRYFGTGSTLGYHINGIESPFLTLLPGKTYRFNQGSASNASHQILFYYDAARVTQYITNVTTSGTAGNAGSYTQIVVTDTTPVVLHYQCINHGYMGNSAQFNSNVVDTPYQIITRGNITAANLSGTNTGDNAVNALYSGLVSNATHTGDATGATALTVVGLRGVALPTLGASAGFLRYTGTGTNTWILDSTAYLTANQSISVTGDASGSGTTAITLTLATVNTNVGTFNNVTVNGKGLVTAASNVSYLTANQSITLSGAVTGTGTTAITTTLANSVVGIANLSATGTPSGTTFLRGDNVWATPAGGGTGTVTTVSVASVNGFAGTVTNASTTPAITLSTTVTGLLKGNGTAISAATAGTDYLTPADVAYSVINVTTTHTETATAGTKVIKCDTTGGAFTVTLPTAVGNKALLIIKKVSGSGALTVDGNSTETIDGGTTATINKVYESITLISDNSNWQIV